MIICFKDYNIMFHSWWGYTLDMHVYETTFKTVSRGYLDGFNSVFRKDDKNFAVNFITW